MSRKQFVALARAIREAEFSSEIDRRIAAEALAGVCSEERPILDGNGNRRFDRSRFLRACGVGE